MANTHELVTGPAELPHCSGLDDQTLGYELSSLNQMIGIGRALEGMKLLACLFCF